jgi:hypothetical protein
MHCYARKSSIYPSPAQCFNDPPHMLVTLSCANFCPVPDPDFLTDTYTYINCMSCCLYNLMPTPKSATAVLLQWTSDTNRTTHVHRHTVQTALGVVQMRCVVLCYSGFEARFKTWCMYSRVREGSNAVILQPQKIWGYCEEEEDKEP